ncbi:hypothetical protein E2C01_071790 [Portunus trituberculatus]|uniref:Uncharacterized protein n=1 Tax=Portunus trituberculatus TaxID=210409 RepID=A0A5B7I8Y0_PORTR|nr:hypothetical protein [Portunus trituberculatus]
MLRKLPSSCSGRRAATVATEATGNYINPPKLLPVAPPQTTTVHATDLSSKRRRRRRRGRRRTKVFPSAIEPVITERPVTLSKNQYPCHYVSDVQVTPAITDTATATPNWLQELANEIMQKTHTSDDSEEEK